MYSILLVEDEHAIRAGLKKLVEEVIQGFEVKWVAGNGKEAMDMLCGQVPDVLITDIRMSEWNGLQLIERLREKSSDLLVLLISGYSDFEYAKQAIRLGVLGYLLKPVDRVELTQYLSKITKILDARAHPPHLLQDVSKETKQERPIIRKVKEFIGERLDQEISLQYISEQVGLNPQYLSSMFKLETGQNFNDYVTEMRMNKAKHLLKNSNLKIYEVAELVGYMNPKHFMASFKQSVGMTPTQFRGQGS
jgi:two-component system response regulator YesN